MNREQIIKEVLIRMDEISPLDAINVLPNPVVDKLLDESIHNILLSAPVHLLPFTSFANNTGVGISTNDVIVQQIQLPPTFLRLVRFRLTGWTRAAVRVTPEGSDTYLRQRQKYTFGGNTRPVVSVVQGPLGLSLEYYTSLNTSPSIVEASCVIALQADEMPAVLLPVLFWYTAAVTLQVYEMDNQAKAAMLKAEEQYKLMGYGN